MSTWDPPASVSPVPGLKVCDTILNKVLFCFVEGGWSWELRSQPLRSGPVHTPADVESSGKALAKARSRSSGSLRKKS